MTGSLSDPDANLVAGAPVPLSERDGSDRYGGPPDRIARIGPEIASLVSEVITQHANEFSERITRRSAEVGDRVARRSSAWGDRVSRRSEHFAERMARRSERFAERLARRAGRDQLGAGGDRVSRRSERFAERMARRSERFAERFARRAGRDQLGAEGSWPRRSVVPVPPPRPPVPYALPRQNVALPLRAAWFVFAGCWMSCIWVLATWVMLCLFVFPAQANRMITMIPNVLTLRTAADPPRSVVPVSRFRSPGPLGSTRLFYMLFVGWWMSCVWMMLAWAISLTVVGIPLSYRMYAVAPTIAHL